ncbi:hypothetical protein JCM19232_924 [Vibrio ishigakensis]|uniref:Uncharacterized protein n=1 Tax=Vibrio ishigakensis TaxID=1481914 RepID=A0A0B8PNJ1_9VIBR|nr:hypothetical protein JCM19232_924 [Vibrio ishigakensis]
MKSSKTQTLIYLAIVVGLLMTSSLPTVLADYGASYEQYMSETCNGHKS